MVNNKYTQAIRLSPLFVKTPGIIYIYNEFLSLFEITKFYSPILCNFISGFQKISSSLRWRSISSSYLTIVFWKTPNISSAAAVSRSLMKPLKHSTEDIVGYLQPQESTAQWPHRYFTGRRSLLCCLLPLAVTPLGSVSGRVRVFFVPRSNYSFTRLISENLAVFFQLTLSSFTDINKIFFM